MPSAQQAVAEGGRKRLRGYSGPGPDPRDPQPFGAVLARLMKARGWQKPAAEARVFGLWPDVVGAEIAAHCRPVKLEDGVLTIEAESTAWATQLRLHDGEASRPDRRRSRVVGRQPAEHPRPGRAVVGQGSEEGTWPRAPRHLWLTTPGRS